MSYHDFLEKRFQTQEGGTLCPYCRPGVKITVHVKIDKPDGTRDWGEFRPMRAKCCPECGRRMEAENNG